VLISHAMFMYTYIGVSVFSTYLRFKHYKGSIIAQHKGSSLYIYIYIYIFTASMIWRFTYICYKAKGQQ